MNELDEAKKLCGWTCLPSLLSCYLQWETLLADKVYIVVENAAKVDKVVSINRFN